MEFVALINLKRKKEGIAILQILITAHIRMKGKAIVSLVSVILPLYGARCMEGFLYLNLLDGAPLYGEVTVWSPIYGASLCGGGSLYGAPL